MKASIVISTYSPKRPDTLFKLLDSLHAQTYKDIEVLVIIDVNRELYRQVDEHIKAYKDGSFKAVFNPENKGLSCSRNTGVGLASGEIIAFIDDDAVPEPDWVSRIVDTFKECPEAVAVVGHTIPRWEDEGMAWFPKELYWMISCSYTMMPASRQEVERGFGVNMAFRKSALLEAGLFNPDFGISGKRWIGGDEVVVFLNIKRMGRKVIFNPEVVVHHDVYKNRIDYRTIVKRAFNQGITMGLYSTLPYYDLKGSTESIYFKGLLLKFYPECAASFFRTLSPVEIKKAVFVSSVIISQGVGYVYSLLRLFFIKK